MRCFKPKADSIHDFHARIYDSPNHANLHIGPIADCPGHQCKVCARFVTHDYKCNLAEHVKVLCTEHDKNIICSGHECNLCHEIWKHDYTCGKTGQGLCKKCASQAAAEINRPKSIEEIKVSADSPLTGREWSELLAEHDNFVVFELIHDSSNGNAVRDDWQDRVSAHIMDLKRKMEILRVKLQATTRAKARQETEDLTKLSPEEIAQYRRDAAKLKIKSEPKIKKEKDDKKKAWEKVIKGLIATYKTMNPKLTDEEARTRALKMIENPGDSQ